MVPFAGLRAPWEVSLVNGIRYPSIGRVCIDQVMIDVGSVSDAREGDVPVLFGNGLRGEPVAQDWADALGTINYEVVTAPRARVSRRFVGGAS